MNGRLRAFVRLLSVQGAWSYERMQGVGMGYAAEPLLRDLRDADPTRHADAVVRSAEFFNSHPYLAGLALGASIRAEYEQVPGEQISRLRTALCGPLGALGDQLFWSGVLPGLVGFALAGIGLGGGVWGVLVFVVVYNALRLFTGYWALGAGLASGLKVGHTIAQSWLPRAARAVGPVAGFAVGFAIPLIAKWLLSLGPVPRPVLALIVAVVGAGLSLRFGARVTAVRFGLTLLSLTVVWRWMA